ncbi:hypothetical protein DWQ65_04635 [Treponema phagedenis]|nr:hypothetical protein DWQ65_04635 [Treponema phagedenis]
MMLKSGKLCNQSCFKTSLLHGITTIHARPEIYIPPVQGCRNALHAKHTRNQPCAAAAENFQIHIHYCVPTTTENLFTRRRTRAKL